MRNIEKSGITMEQWLSGPENTPLTTDTLYHTKTFLHLLLCAQMHTGSQLHLTIYGVRWEGSSSSPRPPHSYPLPLSHTSSRCTSAPMGAQCQNKARGSTYTLLLTSPVHCNALATLCNIAGMLTKLLELEISI